MTFTTRRLFVDDWRENRAIRLEALAECPGHFITPLAEAEARTDDQWRGMLMSATLAIFGLFDGERLAGITAIERTDHDIATLAMSYLRPKWRGRGLSAEFYRARLDWARANGIRRILVGHRDTNTASARAIARHGFVRTHARALHWPDGRIADDVNYELLLDA